MKKFETVPRSIEGDWDWGETSINLPEGWVVLEEKPAHDHIWSFLRDGTMLSRENGRLRYVVKYRYDSDLLCLILNGWQLDSLGELETLIYEIYRVEFLPLAPDADQVPAKMHLYDLEDVQPGEEESLRLTLRRITCCL